MWAKHKKTGFTIVELLIVIVVIGILAAITIVAYNGVQQRAIVASLSSDLDNASKRLKLYQVDNNGYPALINDCPTPAAGNICLKYSPGNTFGTYQFNNTAGNQTFRLTTSSGNTSYHIANDSIPIAGNSSGVITNGLIAYYPFSGSANDVSGNSNNGTVTGATLTSGAIGQAYSFNGVDNFIQIPAVAPYINTTNATMTFSFWIQSSDYSPMQSILSRRDGCNNEGLFNMYTQGQSLRFAYYTTSTSTQYSNNILENGKSYFITWVKPFGQSGVKLYVNGIEVTVAGDSSMQGSSDSTFPTIIGAQWSADVCYGVPAQASQMRKFFNGTIDDVRIYNRALSPGEINTLYNL